MFLPHRDFQVLIRGWDPQHAHSTFFEMRREERGSGFDLSIVDFGLHYHEKGALLRLPGLPVCLADVPVVLERVAWLEGERVDSGLVQSNGEAVAALDELFGLDRDRMIKEISVISQVGDSTFLDSCDVWFAALA